MALTCFAALFQHHPYPCQIPTICSKHPGQFVLGPLIWLFHLVSKGIVPFPFLSSVINSQPSSSSLNILISTRYLLTLLLSINCYLFYLLITFFIRLLVKNSQDCIIICFYICVSFLIMSWTGVYRTCFMLLFYHNTSTESTMLFTTWDVQKKHI